VRPVGAITDRHANGNVSLLHSADQDRGSPGVAPVRTEDPHYPNLKGEVNHRRTPISGGFPHCYRSFMLSETQDFQQGVSHKVFTFHYSDTCINVNRNWPTLGLILRTVP
jgi:hypothetical protein